MRQWTVYPNRVVTEPARPLSEDWADLVDPAWLLTSGWRLSEAGARDVGGRQGWCIWADATDDSEQPGSVFRRAAVVVDAELGILLRLAFLVDDRTAICMELHDVTAPWVEATDRGSGSRSRPGPGWWKHQACSTTSTSPDQSRRPGYIGKTGLAGASALAATRLAERTGRAR